MYVVVELNVFAVKFDLPAKFNEDRLEVSLMFVVKNLLYVVRSSYVFNSAGNLKLSPVK